MNKEKYITCNKCKFTSNDEKIFIYDNKKYKIICTYCDSYTIDNIG